MGLFGGKKKETPGGGDGIYVDMNQQEEELPVAVAIPNPPPTAPPHSPPSRPKPAFWQKKAQQAPLPASKVCQPVNNTGKSASAPPPVVFVTRTPTVLPCCPNCQQRNVRTRIRTSPNWMTWIMVLALLAVFWPLCWIPLVTDSCKRTVHSCSQCNAEIGSIPPFKDCFVKHR